MDCRSWLFGIHLFTALSLSLAASATQASGRIFGIAGKSVEDINFINAWKGCEEEARLNDDTCIHIGEVGPAHFRNQDRALLDAMERRIDGIAVSITNSEFLFASSLRAASERGIPVITFDSDLEKQHASLRSAYVGPDNLGFGRNLGAQAMRLRPQGGSVCLMSGGPYNPNLNARLQGVRQVLSGDDAFPAGQKLKGENGWQEPERCPWYNWDKYDRALLQMREAIYNKEIHAFVSVGAWPQSDLSLYREILMPAKAEYLDSLNKIIIIGIGTPLPEQLDQLSEKLVHAYVSIDFAEMGRISYRYLKKLSEGERVPEVTYTENRIYRWDDPAIIERRVAKE
ncbi:substrate-binding domain-containing protein [Hahella aquimaris]|uniref:substrate-binding domain-containing protein n=1 Tax=Hahella sp. HNIBRBA332 TaxID=3015983 RepID=UPI00273B2855|nr:substrate-binding domain-containing protein [Hahella sp. HNIBRBA332]WLQ13212.1 substrate-binding domain-containing protein [Hahella sp. HNIBRBA332]